MNHLRKLCLAATIVPFVFAAGCGSAGSLGPSASETTPIQPAQPSAPATQETSNLAISSPASGASVSSPFTLAASATSCSSQDVTSMGYALDGSSTYITTGGTALSAQITAAAGAHTVSLVAHGSDGATCNANENVMVTEPPPTTPPVSAPPPAPTGSDLAISSPANNATVTSPFSLKASITACNGQSVGSMGYSFDSGTTTIVNSSSIDSSVSEAAGAHTLYVKAWSSSGAECDGNVSITVNAPAAPAAPAPTSPVPSTAISVSNIEELSTWKTNHDPATGATSSGTMSLGAAPSPLSTLNAKARGFDTTFSGSGGEIYYANFGADTQPTNFFWDGWVYLNSTASTIANLELDMNQVIANGDTIIYGFQCDGYSGTWDYTENAGTVANTSAHWLHSAAPCDVRNWTRNAWHHIQVSYSRDNSGNVTYKSVWLDGTEAQINKTVMSEFGLGWGTSLITNFQIDGLGAGSNTVYLDDLTISRW